jgi:hypothetical protein
MHHLKHNQGFMLLEALLSVGVIVIFISLFVGVSAYMRIQTTTVIQKEKALLLASEGLEVVREIRDVSFASLEDGSHGLTMTVDEWVFSGTDDTSGIYRRTILIEPIAPGEKKVSSSVIWDSRLGQTSVTLATVLTDWK